MNQIHLIAIFTIVSFGLVGSAIQPILAETSLSVSANTAKIFQDEKIMVTGIVSGEATYKPVRLALSAPDGTVIFNPYVDVNNREFKWVFNPPNGIYRQTGTYTVTASHESASSTTSVQFMVMQGKAPTMQENMEAAVIPEFGSMSIVIMVGAIAAVVLLSTKASKFSFQPKFSS